ncbi:methylmalonyl-CoA mutase family protein [Halalkalibaculum sp. DA3122]|uniref:methylmalonyl-CoA mutase family protein n=1 Tax=Halalkalibaculum sp. DA3122 TaxID=3373607 RepID=UPI0037548209
MGNKEIDTGQSLFEEFPPVSREEWEKVIEEDLKGADYRQKLKWETGEGINALPFYRREDMDELEHTRPVPPPDKEKNEWQICQPIFGQDVTRANETARNAIERGAEALQFQFHVQRTEGGLGGDLQGTAIQSQKDFRELLNKVALEDVTLHFDSGLGTPVLMALLHNELKQRNVHPDSVQATFLYDPYSYIAIHGQLPKPEGRLLDEAAQMVSFCDQNLPGVRCLGIDGRTWHEAGATITEELALALATGSEYLAKLSEQDCPVDAIASRIHFRLPIGSNYFLEIAKFRAARVLWEKVVEAYKPDEEKSSQTYIHGETSRWNKPVYDPHTNMLRTSTEGMSAAIAGCDSITINPFNLSYQQPDEFGQRIARNSQIIFKEEAYLDQVYDPGAGSYYIEMLTDKIAAAAWQQFQEIEKQGGIFKALKHGTIATVIRGSVEKRNRAIAERGRIFVGINQYPNPDDRMADKFDSEYRAVSLKESDRDVEIDQGRIVNSLADQFEAGAQLGDVIPGLFDHGKQLFRNIQPYRGTDAFEQLRLATERHPETPTVLMLPLGDRKMRKARSTFAANFFGCAGYDIEDPLGYENIEEAITAVKEQQPDIVVLCSSDQEYTELVEPMCKQLQSLDKQPIAVLAGDPGERIESYMEAGIEAFIHRKSNVLETLKEFHQKLGIELN